VWCGRFRLRGRTVRAWCRLSGLAGQAICRTCRVLHKCCFIFYFMAVCFFNGLWSPFLLWWRVLWMCVIEYLLCLPLLALLCSKALQFSLLGPCQSCWAPSRHGVFWIGCFDGSRIFFFGCVGRFAKNHRPFIISLYDNICSTYFDDVLFVVLSVAAGICPLPDWSALEAE
jgi:hypothetical protein